MVSVIPGDVGKPTVKLDKAVVRDGSCRWESPVYETVKFDQEPKTGKIKERVYNFVVSTVCIVATNIKHCIVRFCVVNVGYVYEDLIPFCGVV